MQKDEVYHNNRYQRNNDAQDNWQSIPENKINKELIFRVQLPKELSKTRGSYLIFTTQGF